MNTSNPTKDQHFVPKFYLKNFADEKGNLAVLKPKEKRMAKSRAYQGLCYAHYFYAAKTGVLDELSQQIEDWFHPMEDLIAKELPRIINIILGNGHIEDHDRYIISVLMSMLYLRTPGMRNRLTQMENNLAEQIKKMHGEEHAEAFKSKDNRAHLKFMVDSIGFGKEGFANAFFNMKWKVYIARGKERFITNDSPIVEKQFPSKTFYNENGAFLNIPKFFALTPKILVELTYPKGATKIKRKTLYENQDEVVRSLNIILVTGSQEEAYSGDKVVLEELLEGIKNPGKLEMEYIRKYEMPWEEHRRKTGR